MKGKMKLLIELFTTFFKIGLFTFGGGYAMIPLIEREVVEGKKWISSDDVLDMLAIAESTPGPLAVNSATFVGYRMAGVLGSAFATIGLAIPSVVIICIISLFLTEFQENIWFQHIFRGIRSGVLVLMVNAVIKFARKCPKYWFMYALMLAAFVLAAFTDIDIAFILLGGGIIGIICRTFIMKEAAEK